MNNLVLVHPPQQGLLEGFSSGLIALANYCSKRLANTSVRLLDLGHTGPGGIAAEVENAVLAYPGDLFVGITTTTASYQSALDVAKIFKRLHPKSIVILGGHHASAQERVILATHEFVDFVIRGEGEVALTRLVEKYPDVSDVPGLSYRQGLSIRSNKTAKELGLLLHTTELDELAPAFNGWGLRSAPGKFDHVTYVSARGCPLRCAFCAVANDKIRAKSVEAVIRDLRYLVVEMGYTSVAIEDNFFAHAPKRTIELCAAIESLRRETSFAWDCQTRVESCLRIDVMEAMERAGCEAVYLGVEALDLEHLLYLRKTSSPALYIENLCQSVVPWLLNSRIDCYINLQLGIPGECAAHRQNTIRQLRRLGEMAAAHGRQITIFPQLHVVYPGTQHHFEALAEGRFGPIGESVFEEFTKWEARQQPVLCWLGEHFAHGTGGIPEGILQAEPLRKDSQFSVDARAVLEIVNYLEEIAKIPGLSIFSYARYLSRPQESVNDEFQTLHELEECNVV